VTLPIGFLVGALLSDLAFEGTGDAFWARASIWLIGAGLAGGALAAGGYPLFGFALAALFVASTVPFLVGNPGRRTTLRVVLLEPPC